MVISQALGLAVPLVSFAALHLTLPYVAEVQRRAIPDRRRAPAEFGFDSVW
jgi:hypothetical protein